MSSYTVGFIAQNTTSCIEHKEKQLLQSQDCQQQ